jgi:rhamnogalacturonyl hydrolase YesR
MKLLSTALADSILARYPDPDTIPYRRWCYVQGYVLIGLEKLWLITHQARYFDYMRKFADQHVSADGSLSDFTGESLDDMMAGTVIVALYEYTREEKYRLAARRIRESFRDYPRNSDGGFWHARSLPHEMWIDGLFMGGMFLTRYGAAVDERDECFNEVARQILTLAGHCRKGQTGLYLHAYDEARHASWADRETGLSSDVWSEGLGWYALVLVEFLDKLPPTHPQRGAVVGILRDLVEGLKKVQDPRTGLWYQVVDQPDLADNWHDTSGSAMFIYCIQRSIELGLVSGDEYVAAVARGYSGLATKAVSNPAGLVDIIDACDGVCVQNSTADYIYYPKVVNAKEAIGSFLWAAGIVEKSALRAHLDD